MFERNKHSNVQRGFCRTGVCVCSLTSAWELTLLDTGFPQTLDFVAHAVRVSIVDEQREFSSGIYLNELLL